MEEKGPQNPQQRTGQQDPDSTILNAIAANWIQMRDRNLMRKAVWATTKT
jgi:hypothetical protein